MKKMIEKWAEKTLRTYGFEHKKTIRAFRIAEMFGCWH